MVIKKKHRLSVKRQCELLGIARSGLYYEPRQESALNLELMRKIDEEYLRHPFFGVPTMWDYLRNTLGYLVSYNRVERLYRIMNLKAICPIPYTSKSNVQHKKYPYLLRDLRIERNNQVWEADITYIPMKKGFMYLIAIIDVYSRYVLNWSVSNNMEAEWCAMVLKEAIMQYGKPEIINTDQGSQFTSEHWIDACNDIKISMDGKGRALDNIFVERLWRSVKYEHVYLYPAADGRALYTGLNEYFNFYNHHRSHKSLDNAKPSLIYQPNGKARLWGRALPCVGENPALLVAN